MKGMGYEHYAIIALKAILSFGSMVLIHLFGAWNQAMEAMLILMFLDICAKMYKLSFKNGGFFAAIKKGKIRSSIMKEKSANKALKYAITLAAGNQLSKTVNSIPEIAFKIVGIPVSQAIRLFFILWICWSEVISILETLVEADTKELEPLVEGMITVRKTLLQRIIDRFADSILGKIDVVIDNKLNEKKKEDDTK